MVVVIGIMSALNLIVVDHSRLILDVYCPSGWIRTGCSAYQSNCKEENCGVHGVQPLDSNRCRAWFDSQTGVTNTVYAYCIKLT